MCSNKNRIFHALEKLTVYYNTLLNSTLEKQKYRNTCTISISIF